MMASRIDCQLTLSSLASWQTATAYTKCWSLQLAASNSAGQQEKRRSEKSGNVPAHGPRMQCVTPSLQGAAARLKRSLTPRRLSLARPTAKLP